MIFPIIAFLAIELYFFIWVLIPYFRFDQFQFWDAAGHYFSAWFFRHYLFPHLSGWNPFFFGGYPEGTFYGPLYHYLIALLSFPLGLPLAFKLVTIISIAILPFSLYYLGRKFKFNPQESSVITILTMIPIAGLSLANGGTLYSQFIVGLGTHSLGLPLFLFYFGKLLEQTDKIRKQEIKQISSLNLAGLTLLAVSIGLLHFVVAFAAVVVALVLILNTFNRQVFVFVFKHGLLVFLLGSFFLLPLLAYGHLTENSGTILSMGFFLTVPSFLLILLGGAASILDKEKRFNQTFFTLMAVYAIMVFMDFGQVGLPMHAYRLIIFFLILAWMLPVKLIFNQIENKAVKVLFWLILIILLGWQLKIMIINNPRAEINNNRLFTYQNLSLPYRMQIELNKVEGRIMLLETQNPLAPRALEHLLTRTSGNYFLKGLFAEASVHAGYINWLQGKTIQVLSGPPAATNQKQKMDLWWRLANLQKLFKLFQINYLLSEAPIKNAQLVKRVSVRSDRPDFYLYQLGKEKIAEVLPYQPYFLEKNWKAAVYQWFESPDPKILVKASELPKTVASSEDTVTVLEEKIYPARLKLNVRAKENIPLLIKISYFPRWKASVEGKPAKIYRVAPSFMLLYGKGEIKLEYQNTLIDQLGNLMTFFGLIWLGLEVFLGLKKEKWNKII